MKARLVALGHPMRGDDGAALQAAALVGSGMEVLLAGRPGAGLLDLLDRPTVLCDVVCSGRPPGSIVRLPLASLAGAALRQVRASSHGLGPADALALGVALGRSLPPGEFVGIEGEDFAAGAQLSPAVAAALPALVEALHEAMRSLVCTNMA